jgi:adenylate cyclase
MERRLAAILAADVVGYSRLIRVDEEGTIAALKALRAELIDPRITEHHGRIVKLMGDGMLAEFPSVVDAVRTAVETQQAVVEHNADLPKEQRIEFRVGINLGDVVIDGDDIHGDGVNVAARLEGLAEPGGICISGKVYEEVRDRTDLAFEDLGEQEVKNIDRPVRAYRIRIDRTSDSSLISGQSSTPPDRPAIAVLPFENMSGDAEQAYFADGLTEDLITALAAWRWFPVIARYSSFAFRNTDQPLSAVARELGARYIVEGSVRRAGERVRVTTELVDATTGHQLWAQRYDRDIRDIFALQDEITESVVISIEPELSQAERTRAMRKPPGNLDAWDLVMKAQGHAFEFSKQGNTKAFELLRQALALEPGLPYALSMLALCSYKDAILGFSSDRDGSLAEARRAAERAVAIDDRDWLAHAILGIILVWTERRFERALEHEERATMLNPSSTWARAFLSCVLEFGGAPEKAIPELEAALRLDPHSPFATFFNADLAIAHFVQGRFDDAIEYASRAIDISPANVRARQRLAASLAQAGRIEEAQDAFRELLRRQPDLSVAYIDETYPFRHAEDRELFIEGLSKAGLRE